MATVSRAGSRSLALDDKALIDGVLDQPGQVPSEYCFANLYLFRRRHRYRLCDYPFLHIRGLTYDGKRHVLPLRPWNAGDLNLLPRSQIDCLYPLANKPGFRMIPAGWTTDWLDADSDYWYDGPRMAQMAFAKPRRAQALQFARTHGPTLERWGSASPGPARIVLDGWLADVGRAVEQTDYAECLEAIALAGSLGLEGGLVRTGAGEPVAFLLASRRQGGIHVVHFAKGRRAHSGAYPWMFARYAETSEARLLNFEQDLGNSGLAQSKRALSPTGRKTKWRLNAPGRSDPAFHLG